MNSTDQDLRLKFLASLFFRQLAYIPEISVQITARTYQGTFAREQLSDFDVLGFRFQGDLRFSRIAAECRSGERKALEEMLKLQGVVSAFRLDRGYFIKSKIHRNAREVAAGLPITTLDEAEIRTLLTTGFGLDLPAAVKHEERRFAAMEQLATVVQREFSRLHAYLRYEFWNLEAYRNIHNLFKLCAASRSGLRDTDHDHRFLFCLIVYYLAIAIIELAGGILANSYNEAARGFAVGLFGGGRERREREVLFDQVNKLLPNPEGTALRFEPNFFDPLQEITVRLIRSANAAASVPKFLTSVIDTAFSKVTTIDPASYDTVTRKLAQDICILVLRETGVSSAFGTEILSY